jgi:hypothetical protein
MKRQLLPLLGLIILMSASCKKQYTCECKHQIYEGPANVRNESTDIKYIKAKSESSAAATCVSNNSSEIDDNGFGHETICSLK